MSWNGSFQCFAEFFVGYKQCESDSYCHWTVLALVMPEVLSFQTSATFPFLLTPLSKNVHPMQWKEIKEMKWNELRQNKQKNNERKKIRGVDMVDAITHQCDNLRVNFVKLHRQQWGAFHDIPQAVSRVSNLCATKWSECHVYSVGVRLWWIVEMKSWAYLDLVIETQLNGRMIKQTIRVLIFDGW